MITKLNLEIDLTYIMNMLDLQQKISILEKILQEPPQNYSDGFKENIWKI
jgi:hypothetical protein